MANTQSAEKALRQSKRKAEQNSWWKGKIKTLVKAMKTAAGNPDILNEQYKELQSTLDKAAKVNVIHKNKAARLKARALKAAHANTKPTNTSESSKPAKSKPSKGRSAKAVA